MQPLELTRIFTGPIEHARIPYFVTGSVASLVYGEPRLTHDVDLVLNLADADARALLAAFPEADFYVPPLEVVRIELRRAVHGHFNLIHHATGFKADIYLAGRDPLHAWAMSRRRRLGEPGRSSGSAPGSSGEGHGGGGLWLAPPEYVILRKLAWYREGGSAKHLRDIRGMLAVTAEPDAVAPDTAPDLDMGELDRWIAALGLTDVWLQASGKAG